MSRLSVLVLVAAGYAAAQVPLPQEPAAPPHKSAAVPTPKVAPAPSDRKSVV